MSFSVTMVGIPDNSITSPKIAPNAVASEDLAVSTVQYAEVEISVAEILALFTTPKTLVAAPGAGKVLEFISLLLAYDWVSVAYTPGSAGNLQVKYTDGAGAAASTTEAVTGFLNLEADALRTLDKIELTTTPVANAPLVLTVATESPTAGDSPIHAKVAYRVHATGL